MGRTYPQRTNTNATIENCTSAALVTDNGHNNCSNYGGIVGYNYYYSDTYFSKVTGCFYYGTAVSASSEAGAIVGLNYKADGTGISNCYYNYPSTISGIGYGNTDNGTTRVYTVTCTTSGLSTTGTATYTHNGTHYFAAGATVTVTLGIANKGITSLSATSGTISDVSIAPDGQSATFTVGSSDVTVSATTDWTDEGVTCVDANGTTQTVHGVTEINSTNKPTTLNGWYVVTEDVSYNSTVFVSGETHLILGDGKTMGISTNVCINATAADLTIYGQDNGSGILSLSSASSTAQCLFAKDKTVTINSGHVNINCNYWGIRAHRVNINGGNVNISAGDTGIHDDYDNNSYNTILSWNKTTDRIKVSSFWNDLIIASGKYFKDASGKVYKGHVYGSSIANVELQPATEADYIAYVMPQTGTNEYTISTTDGWDVFCDLLAAADGKAFFSGKTVKLANDISVTRMASADYHDFCGTFDGGGHTLTFNATATDNYLAPFRNVLGNSTSDRAVIRDLNVVTNITSADQRHTAGLIAEVWGYVDVVNCNVTANITATKGTQTELYPAGLVSQVVSGAQLTVSGCTVGGTIETDGKYAGGIIGIVQGSASIVNSTCGVTINSSTADDGTHGGLVAVSYPGSTNIDGCLFNGKLLTVGTTDTKNCGGFVGWRNTGSVTISNSIYAPADLGNGETEVKFVEAESHPSATFVRNGVSSITNSYYTRTLGAAQGLAAHTITAGENVTVGHAGVATTYDVSHITAYKATAQGTTFIPGLLYNNNVLYAGSGDAVSLTLTNTPPTGYTLDSYTASPDGATLTEDGDNYTLTMPDADVTITATFIVPPLGSVSYIDGNGVERYKQPDEYTVLTGGGATTLAAGWYVVNSDITYTGTVTLGGDVHLILADGCTMNIGTEDDRITSGHCISNWIMVSGKYYYYSLTIYGQANQSGALNAYSNANYINAVIVKNYTQHGGNVTIDHNYDGTALNVDDDLILTRGTLTATVEGSYYPAIYSDNLTFSGGNLTANGDIYSNATLGWTNATDYIHANSYAGNVTIAQGQTLYDEDNTPYSGTIEKVNGAFPINGKTLRPLDNVLVLNDDADNTAAIAAAAVPGASPSGTNAILQGRKLWKDGAWNTLVLPFPIANIEADGCPLKGATVRELNDASITGTTLTLNFKPATTAIAAGTPYIVKWADGEAGQYTQDPVFQGVTIDATTHSYDNQAGGDTNVRFIGTYDQKTVNTEDRSILFMGEENTLYYPDGTGSGVTIGTCRAYFKIGEDGGAGARLLTGFNLNFGDETNAVFDLNNKEERRNNSWYSLDGVKLDGKPTKKGLYIRNGRKVVIK